MGRGVSSYDGTWERGVSYDRWGEVSVLMIKSGVSVLLMEGGEGCQL